MGEESKNVVITGGSGGLGQAMASAFAAAGYDVLINYHRDEDGANTAAAKVRDHGRDAVVLQGDVSVAADVNTMIDTAICFAMLLPLRP